LVDHGGDVRRYNGLVDEAGRGGTGFLHLRPSRDQVAGELLERRALHQHHCPRVDARFRWSRRQCRRGVERIRASWSRCGTFPTGSIVSVLWGSGGLQGVSGARHGLRHDRVRRCRKVKRKGRKGRERVARKAAGDECVFIPWRRAVLADESGSDGGGR
jgi:hypothetical protein